MHSVSSGLSRLALLLPLLAAACASPGMPDAPDMAAGTPQAEQAQASPQKNAGLRDTAHTQKKASGQTPATLTPATDEPQATAATLQSPDETPWLYEGSNVPVDRQWRFGVLDNGLRYATRKNGVPPDQVYQLDLPEASPAKLDLPEASSSLAGEASGRSSW